VLGGVNAPLEVLGGADAEVSRLTVLVGSAASLCITWVAAESGEVVIDGCLMGRLDFLWGTYLVVRESHICEAASLNVKLGK